MKDRTQHFGRNKYRQHFSTGGHTIWLDDSAGTFFTEHVTKPPKPVETTRTTEATDALPRILKLEKA